MHESAYCHSERSEESHENNMIKEEILRLTPQNDIATSFLGTRHDLAEEI
jgi:hypothetical protein